MNKIELIDALRYELDIHREQVSGSTSKKEAEQILDALACAVTYGLCCTDGDTEVVLPGLGKLKSAVRAARTGRNPQTGEPVQIPTRVTVKFSATKALANLLNP